MTRRMTVFSVLCLAFVASCSSPIAWRAAVRRRTSRRGILAVDLDDDGRLDIGGGE